MRFAQNQFVLLAAVTFTTALLVPAMTKQNSVPPAKPGSPGIGRPNFPGAGLMGMGGFLMGGPGRQMMDINPLRSSIPALIMRDDVRTELLISAQQREQIEEIETSSRQNMMSTMRTQIQELIGSVRKKSAPASSVNPIIPDDPSSPGESLTPADRRQRMEDSQSKMQGLMTHMLDDLDAKLEKILKSKQITRLHELDLQMRGPLAMIDPKISDILGLTPLEREKLDQLGSEYQSAQLKVMSNAMRGLQRPIPPPQANPTPTAPTAPGSPGEPSIQGGPSLGRTPLPFDPQAMQAKMAEAKVEAEKSRKNIGKKALTLITPEHYKQWMLLTGRPFTFRILQ